MEGSVVMHGNAVQIPLLFTEERCAVGKERMRDARSRLPLLRTSHLSLHSNKERNCGKFGDNAESDDRQHRMVIQGPDNYAASEPEQTIGSSEQTVSGGPALYRNHRGN